MPTLYILLPVHNRRDITLRFVECLQAQTFADYQLVLIDDGSTDGTAAAVAQRIANVQVLHGDGSWWWAGSLQRGLDWLATQQPGDDALLLMINDDVRFGPDYLARAVATMAGRRDTLVLSRFVDPVSGSTSETGVHAEFRHRSFAIAQSADQINCLSTRGLFLRWRDACRIGRFHPRLLPHYLSDYEYTIRAHRKGLRCETSPDLLIEPDHDATGYHVIHAPNPWAFLRKLFSRKAPDNPWYWSMFILLACEPRWMLPNLARTWVSAAKSVAQAMKSPARPA